MAITNKGKQQEQAGTAPQSPIEQEVQASAGNEQAAQDAALEKPTDVHGDMPESDAVKDVQPAAPSEVLMLSNYVLVLRMPGQDASVTKHFREGQVVANPETIKHLIDNQAPIRYLS